MAKSEHQQGGDSGIQWFHDLAPGFVSGERRAGCEAQDLSALAAVSPDPGYRLPGAWQDPHSRLEFYTGSFDKQNLYHFNF
jgi:hypothetical protein